MDIVDFLPKYPNIYESKYDILNPYGSDFQNTIFHKKEFYENKLEKFEPFPKERGGLTKYQKTIVRFLSSHTPYDRLLLVHDPGLGKCVLPSTSIVINGTRMAISSAWEKYKTGILVDDGEWTTPKEACTVPAYDVHKNTVSPSKVNKLYRQYVSEKIKKIVTQNRYMLDCTKKHKIFSRRGWIHDPLPGDNVAVYLKGEVFYDRVVSVEEVLYTGWVYDLEVDVHHSYVANGIITHNTCSAIGSIEQIRSEGGNYDGALIFAKGSQLLDNFTKQLVEKCTAGQYYPENFSKLTELEKVRRIKKKIQFYQTKTFARFAKRLKTLSDNDIKELFSNKIIVIDEVHNLRIHDEDDEEGVESYQQFHRFLHNITNCKVILMSGTPMKDSTDEIASVMNLLLPLSIQLPTGVKFIEEYTQEKNGAYIIRQDKAEELKELFKGKVSVLKEAESSVPKEFIGEKYDKLRHFTVAPFKMSSFQSKYYAEAYNNDKGGKKGIYVGSREASLFVYPDGSYGSEGFKKYIKKGRTGMVFSMGEELKNALVGKNTKETLKNIKKHSVTYYNVIKNILEANGNCFVYSSLVQGSGGILFSLLLELVGFSRANGTEQTPGLRYGILTNKTATLAEIRKINDRFNRPDNVKGEFIKVIIGSRAVSEGFSFYNVIFESINTPHWNYSETAQAIARGIRIGSHNMLLSLGEKPVVRILQPISIPTGYSVESIDYLMYKISEDKDISIRSVIRILMECAFDCALNYVRNYTQGTKGSRECDYTTCNYTCDGIDMSHLDLEDNELDYSTYQLYYANPNTSLIRKRIEKLIKENIKTDVESIVNNLKSDFTEEEIRSVLYALEEESKGKEVDYKTFLNIYTSTPVRKILNVVEGLFKDHFRLDFNTIASQLPTYTQFEVLTALSQAIEESMPILNKYGFISYLREENNVYFLVDSLAIEPDFYTEYYTKYPNISASLSFEELNETLHTSSLPLIVSELCSTTNEKEFSRLMNSLPKNIQEYFIEAGVMAEDSEIKNKVLSFFKNYIKKVKNTTVSTFLDKLRCYKDEVWADCPEKYREKIQKKEEERKEKLVSENPYGVIAKYNPQNSAFCILDMEKEKEVREKIGAKRSTASGDKRLKYLGKVCDAGGWKLPELMTIIVNRLKIDPPDTFRKKDSIDDMKARIKKDAKLYQTFKDEVKTADRDTLRRILYFGTTAKEGGVRGIKPLCQVMRNWFEEKDLLEIDNQCGVQGKVKAVEGKTAKREFRLEPIVPNEKPEVFKGYIKDIQKSLEECFGETKRPSLDSLLWVLIFSRKKLVGVLCSDNKGSLSRVCVSKNYRRQGIGKEAMKQATDFIAEKYKVTPMISVDNRDKNAKKLIRSYTSYGFEVSRTDARYTFMRMV
jgi:GNAT superfamily N-acetyltransferase